MDELTPAQEAAADYESTLKDLTQNCKLKIKVLTELADEYKTIAPAEIVKCIEQRLRIVIPERKLPILYLIDSICKCIDRDVPQYTDRTYVRLFTQNIVSNFALVFSVVDEKVRSSMYKLRLTWTDFEHKGPIFPSHKLNAIDTRIKELDPAWPILASSSSSNRQPATKSGQSRAVRSGSNSQKPGDVKPQLNEQQIKSIQAKDQLMKQKIKEQQMRQQLIEKQKQKEMELKRQHTQINRDDDEPMDTDVDHDYRLPVNTELSQQSNANPTQNQSPVIAQPVQPPPQQPIHQVQQMATSIQVPVSVAHAAHLPIQTPHVHSHSGLGPLPVLAGPPITNGVQIGITHHQLHHISPIPLIPHPQLVVAPQQPLQQAMPMQPVPTQPITTNPTNQQMPADEDTSPVTPDPKSMRSKRKYLVELLYGGKQCTNCSMRFDENSSRYADHLDWHFRKNRKIDAPTNQPARRAYYYPLHLWCQPKRLYQDENLASAGGGENQSSSNVTNSANTDGNENSLDDNQQNLASVTASQDDDKNICPVCNERFDKFWNEEQEEWQLKNAVRHEDDDCVYHPLCLTDILNVSTSINNSN